MSIMLPKREYVVKALNQMDQSEALLLRMRWGFEDGKPMPISSLAKFFNLTQDKIMEELRRVEYQVLMLARKLEDKAKASS
ncbi:MAG: hypothetical protein GXZ09_07700 [Syntrophomonadaceae bacterium]|jgi:DNA-directed RNA polymerase sigma subunit (sigma70/sigma32)|nr:hypothetical protein [Syntrophomonadaceae bacterium]